jgi:hypothetical protein
MKCSIQPVRLVLQPNLFSPSAVRLLFVVLLVSVALKSGTGRGETSDAAASPQTAGQLSGGLEPSSEMKIVRDARGRKVQVVDFADAHIEGQVRTPDGIVFQSRKSGRFKSLIELRRHFRDNIKDHAMELNTIPVTGN